MGMVDDPATLVPRARSYMHANCAICHRPNGNYPDIDLRFDTDLKGTNMCNVAPNKGTVTVMPPSSAKRLAPGHPELSVAYLRMATLDDKVRMPQVATSVLDPIGTRLISDWIKSITACPP
jgi:mono/diheme cytochrome c family protein